MPTEPIKAELDFMYKIEQHVCNNMLLAEHVVEQGTPPEDFVRFAGTLVGRTETPMGIQEQRIQFPIIGAKSVNEAYAMYKSAAQAHLRLMQIRANTPQIAVPPGKHPGAKPGLILPP